MTSKGLLAGLGAALAVSAIGASDASACRRSCGSYYAPPVAYGFGPPPGYGYVPPAPVYGYGPPPGAYYAPPPPHAAPVYGYGAGHYGRGYYGYRGSRRCGRGHGYGPPVGINYGGYGGYQPIGVWVPAR